MIQVITYVPEHQPYFEQFNKAWIEKYFWLEEIARYVLENPAEAIIAKGGEILMATYNGVVAGTVALKKVDDKTYEFTKMAVDERYRRKGIAEALSYASFEKAKQLGAVKVVLYSNTILTGRYACTGRSVLKKCHCNQVCMKDQILKWRYYSIIFLNHIINHHGNSSWYSNKDHVSFGIGNNRPCQSGFW
jgi:GNAT superfamily N-acetyltransferase